MTCRDFTERLADHLHRALPPRSDRAVRRHAARCGSCRAYLAQYRATVAAVGALAEWDDLEVEDDLDVSRLLVSSVAGRVN